MEKNTYNFLVVAEARNYWVTHESLNLLRTKGNVKNLDLTAYSDSNERCRVFESALQDTDVLICAPWGHQNIPTFTPQL